VFGFSAVPGGTTPDSHVHPGLRPGLLLAVPAGLSCVNGASDVNSKALIGLAIYGPSKVVPDTTPARCPQQLSETGR
jgi:hypothetical protein